MKEHEEKTAEDEAVRIVLRLADERREPLFKEKLDALHYRINKIKKGALIVFPDAEKLIYSNLNANEGKTSVEAPGHDDVLGLPRAKSVKLKYWQKKGYKLIE